MIGLARAAMEFDGLRFMRDPTRAGLAGVCYELTQQTGLAVRLQETDVPVRDPVKMVCEMLGYDPLYLACEGRVVAVTAPAAAGSLLEAWRALPEGEDAAIVGELLQHAAEGGDPGTRADEDQRSF